MTNTLTALLLQLSEGSRPLLWGRMARPHFGPGFDRLLAEGVLVERPPAEEWSTCVNCECGFDARPIQRIGDRIVAACPFDVGSDTELEEDDMRDFRIDTDRIVGLIAEASGFPVPVEMLAPNLWRIGRLASRRFIAAAVTTRVLDQPGIVLLLKAVAGGSPVTVVAPNPGPGIRLRYLEAGIDLIELRLGLKASNRGVDALDLAMLEPGAAAPRLMIERRARRATLDGRSIQLSEQIFSLLLFLAERTIESPATVEIRAIEDHIWGAGIHRISSSIREPIRALRRALATGATDEAPTHGLIQYARNPNGYRLGIAGSELAIYD